uniref:Bola-like protein n=1 Tax=Mycena chlorophos TaxID=658473 RepID=A0ABQ0L4U9_MYCCL|nr:predicted protein [Mycena chlorophos]
MATVASSVVGPVEQSIREKLSTSFAPTVLNIRNDSAKHSHHAPMRAQGTPGGETHFYVEIVSTQAFEGKTTLQRHRLVHSILRDELDAGLHSLSLSTKTEQEANVAHQPS